MKKSNSGNGLRGWQVRKFHMTKETQKRERNLKKKNTLLGRGAGWGRKKDLEK